MPVSLIQVREMLREENALQLSAPEFAKRLYCSESSLRRRLRAHGTSFVKERNAVRSQVAFELLERGYSVEQAGRRVGLTPDHFRTVFKRTFGILPQEVGLIVAVAKRLQIEPRSRSDLKRAERDDRLLQDLLGDLHASHPLNGWAKGLVLVGHHPERQAPAFEEELRKKEHAAYLRQRDHDDAQAVMAIPFDELGEIDVALLLAQKEHRHEQMRWRANQRRRRTRSARGIA